MNGGESMKKKKTPYADYAEQRAGKSKLIPDCLRAFAVGGLICAFAQCLTLFYGRIGAGEEDVKLLVPMTLIFMTAVLTGVGIFDNIARFAGAGTLVPITGFANAVVAPALDGKNEGLVLGLGTKLFSVAGPVILYGTSASVVWGIIYWAIRLIK